MRDRYIQDTRIHCCLYFINPTGHSLRAIDVIVMKKLSEVVNVVPIIAKADTLTLDERDVFKQKVGASVDTGGVIGLFGILQIRAELFHHNIRMYPFDTDDNDDEEVQANEAIRVRALHLTLLCLHNGEIAGQNSVRCRRL